jgi:hypothetical protein
MRANEPRKRSSSATARLFRARGTDLAQLALDVVEVALAIDTPAFVIQDIMAAIGREFRSPQAARWRVICKHIAILITRYYAHASSRTLMYYAQNLLFGDYGGSSTTTSAYCSLHTDLPSCRCANRFASRVEPQFYARDKPEKNGRDE